METVFHIRNHERQAKTVAVYGVAKTAQPIEMPFGLRIQVDPRNRVLDGGPDPHGKCCRMMQHENNRHRITTSYYN